MAPAGHPPLFLMFAAAAAVARLAPFTGRQLQQLLVKRGGQRLSIPRRGGRLLLYHCRKSAMPAASLAFLAMAV